MIKLGPISYEEQRKYQQLTDDLWKLGFRPEGFEKIVKEEAFRFIFSLFDKYQIDDLSKFNLPKRTEL